MKKILFILLMALCVPFSAVYAQDCSDRIQSAGKIYEKYKKTYDKKTLNEARKQLQNLISTPGVPEGCKKEANRLLSTFKPVYKTNVSKSNVDVAPIVVHIDTVVERHVRIDSVVNIVVKHDSMKVKRFYESEEKAQACYEKKDYECAIDNYQTAIGYGQELQMGEGVINAFKAKIERNHKLQYNKMLEESKNLERSDDVQNAIVAYERLKTYAVDNQLIDEITLQMLDDKIYYLQQVQMMYDFVDQADEYYRAREWQLAKDELEVALDIANDIDKKRGAIFWQHRLDTINSILNAGDKIHDYSELPDNVAAYRALEPQLVTVLHNSLLHFINIPADTITLDFIVYPDGQMKTEIHQIHEDTLLQLVILEEMNKAGIKLPVGKFFGQKVPAKASYTFNIGLESQIEVAKRKLNNKIIEDPLIIGPDAVYRFLKLTEDTVRRVVFTQASPDFLYGKFTFNNVTSMVDNTTRSGFHLEKYNGNGGPANVFLSMVVPGLGRHRVTFGQQKGIGTAVFFYASVGASLGLRYYALDKKLDMKNFFNFRKSSDFGEDDGSGQSTPKKVAYWTSYAFAGVAAVIYVSDVLYTLIRGSINAAHQNKYKKWSIGVFYEPASKTPVLQYNYKIK